jgi:hypothetical protein
LGNLVFNFKGKSSEKTTFWKKKKKKKEAKLEKSITNNPSSNACCNGYPVICGSQSSGKRRSGWRHPT